MDIQFIDITSYNGICSNAEHYYAKIGDPKYTQENYLTMMDCKPNSGVLFNGEELRYFPTEKETIEMWNKDNNFGRCAYSVKNKQSDIEDIMEYGTHRFPSITSIVKVARKQFPNSILSFSLYGSVKEFTKYITTHEKEGEEILDILTTNKRIEL